MKKVLWSWAAAVLCTGCLSAIAPPAPPPEEDAARLSPSSVTLSLKGATANVHVMPTGNIAVKTCHQVNCKDEDTGYGRRFFSILLDDHFAPPMPILTYVIEHPEGVFIIDAGVTPRFHDPSTWACDESAFTVSQSILQIDVRQEETLMSRLRTAGIDIERPCP